MRKIISIVGVREWTTNNKRHSKTYAILDDGEEAAGYSSDFEIGDMVEVFYHKGEIKMQKRTERFVERSRNNDG